VTSTPRFVARVVALAADLPSTSTLAGVDPAGSVFPISSERRSRSWTVSLVSYRLPVCEANTSTEPSPMPSRMFDPATLG
jgi:hypothetical protein